MAKAQLGMPCNDVSAPPTTPAAACSHMLRAAAMPTGNSPGSGVATRTHRQNEQKNTPASLRSQEGSPTASTQSAQAGIARACKPPPRPQLCRILSSLLAPLENASHTNTTQTHTHPTQILTPWRHHQSSRNAEKQQRVCQSVVQTPQPHNFPQVPATAKTAVRSRCCAGRLRCDWQCS
jgi:hypothetical protein